MLIVTLIAAAWLSAMVVFAAMCRMAARGDETRHTVPAALCEPEGAEIVVLRGRGVSAPRTPSPTKPLPLAAPAARPAAATGTLGARPTALGGV